jgi:hypothetical protein
MLRGTACHQASAVLQGMRCKAAACISKGPTLQSWTYIQRDKLSISSIYEGRKGLRPDKVDLQSLEQLGSVMPHFQHAHIRTFPRALCMHKLSIWQPSHPAQVHMAHKMPTSAALAAIRCCTVFTSNPTSQQHNHTLTAGGMLQLTARVLAPNTTYSLLTGSQTCAWGSSIVCIAYGDA